MKKKIIYLSNNLSPDDFVYYLTSSRCGLYLNNILVATVEEVQSGIDFVYQTSLGDFYD